MTASDGSWLLPALVASCSFGCGGGDGASVVGDSGLNGKADARVDGGKPDRSVPAASRDGGATRDATGEADASKDAPNPVVLDAGNPGHACDPPPADASAPCELAADEHTLALYHFDEGTGQRVRDSSGHCHDGTLGFNDSPGADEPTWTAGRSGAGVGALHYVRPAFTAPLGPYVDVQGPEPYARNELTIEAWLRPVAPYGYSQWFTSGSLNCYVAINTDGSLDFSVGNGRDWTDLVGTTGNVNDGKWHFVAATYDGATMSAYIDGVVIASMPATVILAKPDDYKLGGRLQNTFLNGDLDELRVSGIARSASSIAATSAAACP